MNNCQTCKSLNMRRANERGDLGDAKAKLVRAQDRHPEQIPELVTRVKEAKERAAATELRIEEHEAACRVAQRPALAGLHNDYVREAAPLPPAVELAAMVKAGVSTAEIAEEYGCSKATVNARLSMSGFLAQKAETDEDAPPVAAFAALRDATWMADALCAQVDPDLFFPEKGGSSGVSTAEAKKVCSLCTVAAECLDFALTTGEPHGIWGGVTGRSRRERSAS